MARTICKEWYESLGRMAARTASGVPWQPAGGMMGRIYVVGTADTKGEELLFLAACIREAGGNAAIIDLGTRPPGIPVEIPARQVAALGPPGLLEGSDRGLAMAGMAEAFARFAPTLTDIDGMVGIGGGGGTAMVTAGMRALPIGLPKLMVSTLASGDVAPYVGIADIVMMPAITDLAGLNRISREVLANAAYAVTAMSRRPPIKASQRPAIGLTMFGVTTPAVTRIVTLLGQTVEPVVFHATGTGGRTMEALVDSGLLTGVMDITTTEICDLVAGGVLAAGSDRLDCIARTKVPYVGSVGACDMVNFWAPDTIPAKYRDRLFYRHNPNVTLMRTTPDENRAVGRFIAEKLNRCHGPVRFLIPERGVSALDIAGGTFHDPVADEALFSTIATQVEWGGNRRLIRLDCHINDPAFAEAAVAAFNEIAPGE